MKVTVVFETPYDVSLESVDTFLTHQTEEIGAFPIEVIKMVPGDLIHPGDAQHIITHR